MHAGDSAAAMRSRTMLSNRLAAAPQGDAMSIAHAMLAPLERAFIGTV